ncbi:MAG TPA: cob(I)yrinic acid a,c-diamide adenosyltransferase [Chthonomonadaceae bacterium]|nr:cob(I)yrinic acid a,c-diamide adenosyltransferase [Chthonomonadaceae bacterium]
MPSHIYTRTGDTGDTGLFGGQRVGKDDARVEAYGTVDELNAVLGVARAQAEEPELNALLLSFQDALFRLGSDLATPDEASTHKGNITIQRFPAEPVTALEALIDRFEAELPPLRNFILPGGHALAAALHHGRVVCRRAERRCVALARLEADAGNSPLNPEIVRYLNRLSDLLFVLARLANHRQGVPDVPWRPT